MAKTITPLRQSRPTGPTLSQHVRSRSVSTFHGVVVVLMAVAVAVAVNVGSVFAQPAARPPLELTEQPTTDSQVEVLRGDLLTAITHGASPEAITGLLSRQRRIDGLLESQLASNRQELAEIERDGFDPDVTPRREELRRQQSLLWLARVE
ncbi:MAG: hypothetical protein ACF8CQ_17660, partial [Rhodopirellula sp. JB044]